MVLRFWTLILVFSFWSCSQWTPDRGVKRGVSSQAERTTFTAYHNFSPSRRSGGSVQEVKFLEPKLLTEISLEFVNYKVFVSQIDLVSSSGRVVTIPGFKGRTLEPGFRHLTLKNLPAVDNITSVRIKAEGFSSDDVIYTVSFFSPQGFLAKEQGKNKFSHITNVSYQPSLQVPVCLQTNENFKGVLFDIEKINQLAVAEKRYFCHEFLSEFKLLLEQNSEITRFLRLGENLEKPLVILGRSFFYDRFKNEVTFPLLLKRKDFHSLVTEFKSSTQKDQDAIKREISQYSDDYKESQQLSYDEYMERETDSVDYLEYQDQWSFEDGEKGQKYCTTYLNKMGFTKSLSERNCKDVSGFEDVHIACMQGLNELNIMLSNIHHYCLEARGKLSFYRPCMKKVLELNFNHYDANLFCQRTPKDFISGQLSCLEVMVEQGFSKHQSMQTCQERWGKEQTLVVCLDEQKNRISDRSARLNYCRKR